MILALATNNPHKLKEIRAILGDSFHQLKSLDELGIDIEIEETGATLQENALIKAQTICDITGLPALADDTGLMVDALDGAPGVYSARYAGDMHDDAANRALLLKNLDGVEDRRAHFCTCVAIVYPDGLSLVSGGRVNGRILREERGENGFGYDSLFFSDELGKTFAEASAEEKNRVSHRSRALRAMLNLIDKRG